MVAHTSDYDFSITVFDDASTDDTGAIALANSCAVERIHKSRGLGYVFTQITSAFLKSGADFLVTIDADNQFDPNEIPLLLAPLTDGRADFVTGSRFLKQSNTSGISAIKKIGNKVGARYISSILGEQFSDVTCGFRASSREAILQLHTFADFTYTQEVFLNLGIKKISIVEIPITTIYHKERKSKIVTSVCSYIAKSLKIILKFTIVYAPMRLFGTLGNLSFLLAIASSIFVFFWNQATGSVTPYKWLAVVGVSAGGAGLLFYSVGILLQITSRIQLTIEKVLYESRKR